jgi:peptidoglycan glycosyltransferase
MRPYLVEEIRPPNGLRLSTTRPEILTETVSPQITATLTAAMLAVVQSGTGRSAALEEWSVAGKTGSAQNPHGQTHAWFVGFAPAEKPRVAVAVLIENAGTGGEVAAPIAREVFRGALGLKR